MTETRQNKIEQIEMRGVESLVPYARNARTHSDAQIEKIAASIREFGFVSPVLIDGDGGIIAGHGRVLAAKFLGLDEVPCRSVGWLSDEQKRAYILADNRLAELSDWDMQLLGSELGELTGFDMSLFGFEAADFAGASPNGGNEGGHPQGLGSLSDSFGVPPFSVLSARDGWWQDRKRAWVALGIQSEVGRGENLLKFSDSVALDGQAYKERFSGKAITKGAGWGDGGPARRDPAFYAKKRAWEKANGRKISTTEFRETVWSLEQANG